MIKGTLRWEASTRWPGGHPYPTDRFMLRLSDDEAFFQDLISRERFAKNPRGFMEAFIERLIKFKEENPR